MCRFAPGPAEEGMRKGGLAAWRAEWKSLRTLLPRLAPSCCKSTLSASSLSLGAAADNDEAEPSARAPRVCCGRAARSARAAAAPRRRRSPAVSGEGAPIGLVHLPEDVVRTSHWLRSDDQSMPAAPPRPSSHVLRFAGGRMGGRWRFRRRPTRPTPPPSPSSRSRRRYRRRLRPRLWELRAAAWAISAFAARASAARSHRHQAVVREQARKQARAAFSTKATTARARAARASIAAGRHAAVSRGGLRARQH